MDMVDECYMCDAAATSEEHAPPESFYPKGYRSNLIKVPSCAEHNEANSKDVEYVRNVISTQHGTNGAAALIFEKTKRSFDHSPKLTARTFRDLKPVMIEGVETGAFPVDLTRHKRVMAAIAYALYFHTYGRKHRGDWRIFTPSFGYAGNVHRGESDPWEGFRSYVESGQYKPMPVPQPEVFKYGLLEMEQGQIIYRFEFYERVVVMAWTRFMTFAPLATIWVPGR
jgi:hypothetical protein